MSITIYEKSAFAHRKHLSFTGYSLYNNYTLSPEKAKIILSN